jgi:hypothetical protein
VESYIDVRGQAEIAESVVEYRAALTVSVKGARPESAYDEVVRLRNRTVHALNAAGLADGEVKEGGGDTWLPFFW